MSEEARIEHDRLSLKAVIGYVESVPEGRALIALAKEWNCPISYDYEFKKQDSTGGYIRHESTEKIFQIAINPNKPIPRQVLSLCHELRHLQQFTEITDYEKFCKLSPPLARIARRVYEADAYVFQMHMAKKIGRETGLKIPFRSGDGSPLFKNHTKKSKHSILLKLVNVTRFALRELMHQEYMGQYNPMERFRDDVNWKGLFADFQYSATAFKYDAIHDSTFQEDAKEYSGKQLNEKFNQKSFRDVVNFSDMCRQGVNKDAPCYMNADHIDLVKFVGESISNYKFKKDRALMYSKKSV